MDAKKFTIALIFLFAGVWLGFHLERIGKEPYQITVKTAFQKPLDTKPMGGCTPGVGIRQARESDLPHGPMYLTYQGKTVGVEFTLTEEELSQKKNWLGLPLQEASTNHMDIVLVADGDEIVKTSHYDIRFYTITPELQQAITCRS